MSFRSPLQICCAAALAAAATARAQERAEPRVAEVKGRALIRAELPGASEMERRLESAELLQALGSMEDAILTVDGVARDAQRVLTAGTDERTGVRQIWLQARIDATAWRLDIGYEDHGVLEDLEDIVQRARAWGERRLEGSACLLAARIGEQGVTVNAWISAADWYDRASQVFLDAGAAEQGSDALLSMARLCRAHEHPWRLAAVHERLRQIDTAGLPGRAAARLAAELERGTGMAPRAAAVKPSVLIEPLEATSYPSATSADGGEIARLRYVLTNATARTVQGTLSVSGSASGVSDWAVHTRAHLVQLDPALAGGTATAKVISLLPGQQLPVYIERLPGADEPLITVQWTDAKGTTTARGACTFTADTESAGLVNAANTPQTATHGSTLYHEIYNRRSDPALENLSITSDQPCRLELFDLNARLLAVDCNGDGHYLAADGDFLGSDADSNGLPDLAIEGAGTQSIEVQAWPLGSLSESPLRITVSLDEGRVEMQDYIVPAP